MLSASSPLLVLFRLLKFALMGVFSPISVNLSQNVPEQEKRRAEASVLW